MRSRLSYCLLDFVLVPPLCTALAVWFYTMLDHYYSAGLFADLWTVFLFHAKG